MFLCYNINIEQKFEEEYIMKKRLFIELLKYLNDTEKEELKVTLFEICRKDEVQCQQVPPAFDSHQDEKKV